MRVLVWDVGLCEPESAYRSFYVAGMQALGHQVIACDSHALAELFGLKGMQDVLLAYARAYRVNVALLPATCYVEPWFCQALKAAGVVLVRLRHDDCLHWAPGKPYPPDHVLRQITYLDSYCDLAVTTLRRAPRAFADHGCPRPEYVPHPVSWQVIEPCRGPRRPVIVFGGAPKHAPGQPPSWRIQCARALIAAGLPVELHHDGWAQVPGCEGAARPTPGLRDFHRVLGSAQVNGAFAGDYEPKPFPQLRLLNLEIAAAGSMQLAYPCEELADYFAVGRDVATFTDLDDLVAKARYYLDHPAEALEMGLRSRRAIETTGGWDRWWATVADLLARRGVRLDLTAPPLTPDPAETPLLSLANVALGHACEANGRAGEAAHYYREVLAVDSMNHAAAAGLARLAGDGPEALTHWQTAARTASFTMKQAYRPRFGWPGVSESYFTAYRAGAAFHWLEQALRVEDEAAIFAALREVCAVAPQPALGLVRYFADRQNLDAALQCCDVAIGLWPDFAEAYGWRAEVLERSGRITEAAGDRQRQAALAARPRQVP